jgi:5-methylcytosine-specific restriction endonuclease McrA
MSKRPGERGAVFCRLEHVVPWAMQGAHWNAGMPEEPGAIDAALGTCAHCGEPLGDVRVTLIRHRGEHRIPDDFCSVDHAAAWARSGGRWQ